MKIPPWFIGGTQTVVVAARMSSNLMFFSNHLCIHSFQFCHFSVFVFLLLSLLLLLYCIYLLLLTQEYQVTWCIFQQFVYPLFKKNQFFAQYTHFKISNTMSHYWFIFYQSFHCTSIDDGIGNDREMQMHLILFSILDSEYLFSEYLVPSLVFYKTGHKTFFEISFPLYAELIQDLKNCFTLLLGLLWKLPFSDFILAYPWKEIKYFLDIFANIASPNISHLIPSISITAHCRRMEGMSVCRNIKYSSSHLFCKPQH